MTQFHIVWTLALLIAFLGIVVWAWSGRRKKDFEEAANLPLEDSNSEKSDEPKN